MKANTFLAASVLALSLGLTACVSAGGNYVAESVEEVAATPAPTPTPTPTPEPRPTPPPIIPVVEEPTYDSYLDAPQTPGTWVYEDEPGEKIAVFVSPSDGPLFVLRCATGSFAMARATNLRSDATRAMSISTETTTRELQVAPLPDRPLLAVDIDPRDPLLDAMAITKGRFAVGVEGERTLYLPAWAEVSRVIEDCR